MKSIFRPIILALRNFSLDALHQDNRHADGGAAWSRAMTHLLRALGLAVALAFCGSAADAQISNVTPPPTITSIGLPGASASGISNARVVANLPPEAPALNVVPIVTASATACSGTNVIPTTGGAGATVKTTNYTFTGSANYIVPSITFPYYDAVIIQQQPSAALGFGSAYAETLDDDSSVCIKQVLSELSSTRVLVDGSEIYRVEQGIHAGYAQAGGANTITLDSGASATNGEYLNNWIHVTAGTAVGEYCLIIGYVGSTKVATCQAAWATNPAAGDAFEITDSRAQFSDLTFAGSSFTGSQSTTVLTVSAITSGVLHVGDTVVVSGGTNETITSFGTGVGLTGTYNVSVSQSVVSEALTVASASFYITASYSGERRMRHWRIAHSGQGFYGVWNSSAISTTAPVPKAVGMPLVVAGDSFACGTGAGMANIGGWPVYFAQVLGRDLILDCIGGTGLLNPNSGVTASFTLPQRWFPPVNAWFVQYNGATSGSFTLTQNSVSVTVNYNDSGATVQSSFNTAFGSTLR